MRFMGEIFDGCTIALSSPALTASAKKTELRTIRAAGLRPNETLLTPRVVCTSGNSIFNWRIASIVSIASRRVSSCPVAIGKVKQSMMMSETRIFHFSVRSVMRRLATRSFHSLSRAWPSSSIVRATNAAPCSFAIGMILAKRESGPSPSS